MSVGRAVPYSRLKFQDYFPTLEQPAVRRSAQPSGVKVTTWALTHKVTHDPCTFSADVVFASEPSESLYQPTMKKGPIKHKNMVSQLKLADNEPFLTWLKGIKRQEWTDEVAQCLNKEPDKVQIEPPVKTHLYVESKTPGGKTEKYQYKIHKPEEKKSATTLWMEWKPTSQGKTDFKWLITGKPASQNFEEFITALYTPRVSATITWELKIRSGKTLSFHLTPMLVEINMDPLALRRQQLVAAWTKEQPASGEQQPDGVSQDLPKEKDQEVKDESTQELDQEEEEKKAQTQKRKQSSDTSTATKPSKLTRTATAAEVVESAPASTKGVKASRAASLTTFKPPAKENDSADLLAV